MAVDEGPPAVDQKPSELTPRRSEHLRVTVSWIEDVAVVKAVGEIDLGTAPLLHEQLVEITADLKGDLVLDLSQVTFVDSTGLSVLVVTHNQVKRQGGRFLIYGPTPEIRRIFETTGLTSLLTTLPE